MQIHTLSAGELLAHLGRGELSSVEIVEALHARADAVGGQVNGFVHRFRERSLAEAERADQARARGESLGPLHGLPISIKESVDTEGLASSLGMKARLGHPAARDAVTVALARAAGAIVIGKTNVPQTLLSSMETTNFIWGATRNPFSLAHGPGGSSGGEGAVIASGQSVMGIGTDIGGSLRFPAGFCGVAAIKPTLHRWSNVGSRTAIVGQEVVRSQIGPMARTTADVSLLLRALDSPLHAPHDPGVPPLAIGDPKDVDVSSLRIGWYDDDRFFRPAAAVRRAVREAVATLRAMGATLVELPPDNAAKLTHLYLAALSSDGARTLDEALEGEETIDPLKLVRRSAKLPSAARKAAAYAARLVGERRLAGMLDALGRKDVHDLWALTDRRSRYVLEENDAWRRAGVEALICPLHPTMAVPHGMSKDFTLSFCYAARYNLLNLPAGVVPITRVRDDETEREVVRDRIDKRAAAIQRRSAGLPVSVQVVGRPWREDTVLAVMQALEDAARQRPGFPWTPVDPTGGA